MMLRNLNVKTRWVIGFSFFLSLTGAYSALAASCPDMQHSASENLQVQTTLKCEIFLNPDNAWQGYPYRDYIVSPEGIVEIDDNLAPGKVGGRTYFFFPRKTAPTFQILPNEQVQVVTTSGAALTFDPGAKASAGSPAKSPHLVSNPSDPIQAKEVPGVSQSDAGGVTFTQTSASNTLILDAGFGMGKPLYVNSKGSSTFRDASGTSCSVVNSRIFSYKDPSNPTLLYADDADLWKMLKTACPNLKLPPAGPSHAGGGSATQPGATQPTTPEGTAPAL
jgi:hypothetical protein